MYLPPLFCLLGCRFPTFSAPVLQIRLFPCTQVGFGASLFQKDCKSQKPSPSLLRNATNLPLSLCDISLRPEGVFPRVGGKSWLSLWESCRAEARLRGHCQNEPPCAERTTAHFFLYPLAFRCSSAGVMPNSRLYWAEKWLKLLYPSCTATLLTVRLVVRSSRWASSSFCWMT